MHLSCMHAWMHAWVHAWVHACARMHTWIRAHACEEADALVKAQDKEERVLAFVADVEGRQVGPQALDRVVNR